MSNNIDLKELWNKQETAIPETKEFFEKAIKFKRINLIKLLLANILLISTSAFIVFIWFYYQPEMIITKIGIFLIISAIVIYLFVYNQLLPTLMKMGYEINSNEYLRQLLKLKAKQLFLQSTMLNIYFILLSTGICMYMYEHTSRMTFLWAVISYGLTLLWIAVNWFYFRPRTIKKQQTKINELISKFEMLSQQLTADAK